MAQKKGNFCARTWFELNVICYVGGLFDWIWNIRALVRAKRLSDPGTTWLWLVGVTCQAMRFVDTPQKPMFFQAWPSTDTGITLAPNGGVYPEAIAAVPNS